TDEGRQKPAKNHPIHLSFQAAPGRQNESRRDSTDAESGLDKAQSSLAVARPRQDHGRENSENHAGEQIAEEKGHLQTEQAGTGKNVAKAINRFLPQIALACISSF